MKNRKMKNIAVILCSIILSVVVLSVTGCRSNKDREKVPNSGTSIGQQDSQKENEQGKGNSQNIQPIQKDPQQNGTEGNQEEEKAEDESKQEELVINNDNKGTTNLVNTVPKQEEISTKPVKEENVTTPNDQESGNGEEDEGIKKDDSSKEEEELVKEPVDAITLDAVKNLKAKKRGNSIILTWDAVQDADGYQIYGKTEKGEFDFVKSVKENTATITEAELKLERTYLVRIQAYVYDAKKDAWICGEYSEAIRIFLNKQETDTSDDENGQGNINRPGNPGSSTTPNEPEIPNKPDPEKPDPEKPDPDKPEPDKPAEKLTYDTKGWKFEQTEVYNYDGVTEYTLEVTGLPSGVTPIYEIIGENDGKGIGNRRKYPGSQTIQVSFQVDEERYNPVAPMVATLTVGKANLNPKDWKFKQTTHTYDGTEQTFEFIGYPKDIVIPVYKVDGEVVEEIKWKNAGSHTVQVSFQVDEELYNPIDVLEETLTIEKAEIPHGEFETQTFAFLGGMATYDYELDAKDLLPEGVSLSGRYQYKLQGSDDDFEEFFDEFDKGVGVYIIRAELDIDESYDFDEENYNNFVTAKVKVEYIADLALEQTKIGEDTIEVVIHLKSVMNGLWLSAICGSAVDDGMLEYDTELLEIVEFQSYEPWCNAWEDKEACEEGIEHWGDGGGIIMHTNVFSDAGIDIVTEAGEVVKITFRMLQNEEAIPETTKISLKNFTVTGGYLEEGWQDMDEDDLLIMIIDGMQDFELANVDLIATLPTVEQLGKKEEISEENSWEEEESLPQLKKEDGHVSEIKEDETEAKEDVQIASENETDNADNHENEIEEQE